MIRICRGGNYFLNDGPIAVVCQIARTRASHSFTCRATALKWIWLDPTAELIKVNSNGDIASLYNGESSDLGNAIDESPEAHSVGTRCNAHRRNGSFDDSPGCIDRSGGDATAAVPHSSSGIAANLWIFPVSPDRCRAHRNAESIRKERCYSCSGGS